MSADPAPAHGAPEPAGVQVRHLRQVLLWPLRLIVQGQPDDAGQRRAPWQLLRDLGEATPWREHVDEYQGAAGGFHERHYNEFVTFLPYVQRFLYGEARAQARGRPGHRAPGLADAGVPPPRPRRGARGAASLARRRRSRCRSSMSTCISSTTSTSCC
jgi:hypothetical protein